MKHPIFCFYLLLALPFAAYSQDHSLRIAFYNVENLFDTADNLEKLDDDFTPEGKNNWTAERYETKLDRIAEVIASMDFPAVVGLCEIENDKVLADLCKQKRIKNAAYEHLSYDSPDLRGIDNGLLYNTEIFELVESRPIQIDFPLWLEPEGYTSRDILVVSLRHRQTLEQFHFFVNHWPSRRGGVTESEHRRLWVASHLRHQVDALFSADPFSKVIILGDFNDEPENASVLNALGTLPVQKQRQLPGLLYNPFLSLSAEEEGSYNYRGDWNMLDQIIYAGLQEPNQWRVRDFGIFRKDWLLHEGTRPNRTYGGPNYYGGYSDHLPVFLDIEWTNQ